MTYLATVQNQGKDAHQGCYVADVSRSAGGGVFLCFSGRDWEGICRKLLSSKAVPEVLGMKYRSEFKHGFTNCGCLHCFIVKALP